MFALPQTAPATKALYRSLIEASLWKPVWCVLGTLLWSTGVSDIQGDGSSMSFLSAVCFCLFTSGSLVATPMVVHALAGAGLSSLAQNVSGVSIPGVGTLSPLKGVQTATKMGKHGFNMGLAVADFATRAFPRANKMVRRIPPLNVPPRSPLFKERKEKNEGKHGRKA